MSKASDEARRRWLAEKDKPSEETKTREAWRNTKAATEKTHIHFMCTCHSCALQFAICGLPCFVICPGCHCTLKLQTL